VLIVRIIVKIVELDLIIVQTVTMEDIWQESLVKNVTQLVPLVLNNTQNV
jgi:hypothetical protein